jgi:hypothetical protein
MNINDLTKDERLVAAAAINHYGAGEHPFACEENLEHFKAAYAAKCLAKAAPNFRRPYAAAALTAMVKLDAASRRPENN